MPSKRPSLVVSFVAAAFALLTGCATTEPHAASVVARPASAAPALALTRDRTRPQDDDRIKLRRPGWRSVDAPTPLAQSGLYLGLRSAVGSYAGSDLEWGVDPAWPCAMSSRNSWVSASSLSVRRPLGSPQPSHGVSV